MTLRRSWCRIGHRRSWRDRSVVVGDRVTLPAWYCPRCGEAFSRRLRELPRWEEDPRIPRVLGLALRTTAWLSLCALMLTVTLMLLVAAWVWYGPQ